MTEICLFERLGVLVLREEEIYQKAEKEFPYLCVRESERVRERERDFVCVYKFLFVCACEWNNGCGGKEAEGSCHAAPDIRSLYFHDCRGFMADL